VTASRIPTAATPPVASLAPAPTSFTSPIIDYEPPLVGVAVACSPPTPAALHRHTTRRLRAVPAAPAHDAVPPRAAAIFADTALRRVLEVADRRRPIAQLRPLLAPALIDVVVAMTRTTPTDGAAVLRRVRLRTAGSADGEATTAEVFGTYTRGRRVRAIAGRIEIVGGRWLVTALQIG
jgi:hypothetical protein